MRSHLEQPLGFRPPRARSPGGGRGLVCLVPAWLHRSGAGECRASRPVAERLKPLAKGEMAALAVNARRSRPRLSPSRVRTGRRRACPISAAGRFWSICGPPGACPAGEEMPALDKLQAELGGQGFRGRGHQRGYAQPRQAQGLAAGERDPGTWPIMPIPRGKLLQVLQKSGHVVGLPTTFMVDAVRLRDRAPEGPGRMGLARRLARSCARRSAGLRPGSEPSAVGNAGARPENAGFTSRHGRSIAWRASPRPRGLACRRPGSPRSRESPALAASRPPSWWRRRPPARAASPLRRSAREGSSDDAAPQPPCEA